MNSSKYSWRGFLKKVSQEQKIVSPEKFEEYIIKFFTELKKQLNSTDTSKIGDVYVRSLGGFEVDVKYCIHRLLRIEFFLTVGKLVNPEEHLRQILVIEHVLQTKPKLYDKYAERISRIKDVLAHGECGFSGSGD